MTYGDSLGAPAGIAALAALADPTRRAIVEGLRAGPMPVGRIAAPLPVSRPAVSQHLKVLSDAGLVEAVPQGNRRLYHLSGEGIAALRAYLDTLWDDALAAFAREAEAQALRSAEPNPDGPQKGRLP